MRNLDGDYENPIHRKDKTHVAILICGIMMTLLVFTGRTLRPPHSIPSLCSALSDLVKGLVHVSVSGVCGILFMIVVIFSMVCINSMSGIKRYCWVPNMCPSARLLFCASFELVSGFFIEC